MARGHTAEGPGLATSRDSDKFIVRLPDGMRERIKAEADKNNRSMNAEIVARLEGSFEKPTPSAEDIATKLVEHLRLIGVTIRVPEDADEEKASRGSNVPTEVPVGKPSPPPSAPSSPKRRT